MIEVGLDVCLRQGYEAIILAEIAAAADVDPGAAPVDALKAAHAKVLKDIIDGIGPISRERRQTMGTVVMNSPELQQAMSAHRKATLGPVIAKRQGVAVTDPSVGLAVTMWSAVVAATYSAAPDKERQLRPARRRATPTQNARAPQPRVPPNHWTVTVSLAPDG